MMRPSEATREPRIASLVTYNLSSLKSLVDSADLTLALLPTANSHLARFKLWSATLGAHRFSGNRSLEYRLRDASSVRSHVLSLLQDLSTAIDEARSPAEKQPGQPRECADDELQEYFRDGDTSSQTSLDRPLTQIGYIMDCLLRLSTIIGNPAPHDHFESRFDISEFYEPLDVRHVQEKFIKVDPCTAERLGKAITVRRHYFNYRHEHHARLSEGVISDVNIEGDETTIASSIPEKFNNARETTAQIDDDLDNQSEMTATSYATSSADTDTDLLMVPGIPKEHLEGPFLCPFCQMIIDIHTRRYWKQHVFRDLRPYICLEKSCPIPNQQYTHRSQWKAHMTREHWKTWHCPFGCSELFLTRDDWSKHNVHSHETPLDGLELLEECSIRQASEKAAGTCPMCSDVYIKDSRSYTSHVGHHLEQLALFALPKIDGDDDDYEYDEETAAIDELDSGEENEGTDDEGQDTKLPISTQESVDIGELQRSTPQANQQRTFLCTHPSKRTPGMPCGAGFMEMRDLIRHSRSVHATGEGVCYRCRCGASIARKDNHLRHVMKCNRDDQTATFSCKCGNLCVERSSHWEHVNDCSFFHPWSRHLPGTNDAKLGM